MSSATATTTTRRGCAPLARACITLLAIVTAACASLPQPSAHPPRAVPAAPLANPERPVIAFVLGGGGARGFAHAGVLKVLDDAGIHADLVVGTSAGSIVGALYAGGIRNTELIAKALAVQRDQLVGFVLPNRGFIEGARLQAYVDDALHGRLIEQLDLPFVAVATELHTGRLVAFNRGDTGLAVRASSSVPAIFQPAVIDGDEYVDGGLVSPVPVSVARKLGAELVIAVDVSRQPRDTGELDTTPGMLNQTFVIMEHALAGHELARADIVVRPELSRVPATDLAERGEAIRAGEAAARAALPRIRQLVAQMTAAKRRARRP